MSNTEQQKTEFKITETTAIKNSSNISSIFYTDIGALLVQFKNGGEYLYKKVPKEIYEELAKSDSAGKYLTLAVKGKFEFEKVEKKKVEQLTPTDKEEATNG